MTEITKMWKFVRGKSQQPSAERQKWQKEAFSFSKTVHHGFPNKPSALAWDSQLRIAAIGTATGAIQVFGKCGVEFYGQHSPNNMVILRLLFVPNEGKLISLCEDNSLHLWEINDTAIKEVESFVMEGKVKRVSSLYVDDAKENLLVGTEGGNIYSVDLETFSLSENIIYQDVTMQNVPDGKKINPGAVEAIAEQPGNADNLLIGYRRGLMVLWNKSSSTAVQTYVNNQQLESFSWDTVGKKFLSSHNDGSYVFWSTESSEPVEEPITVYGPFPCKAITKILWCNSVEDAGENLIVFSGGMPRASYSDRHTVTIQQGTKHAVLDFTSKVIDFFATYTPDSDICESLIVLLEEELVAVDLTTSEWRAIPLPYLISLHCSAVTALTYVNDISESVWDTLLSIGKKQTRDTFSPLEWPINGGILKKSGDADEAEHRDLLITGHEDGSIRFWNAGSTVLSLVYIFKSNILFLADDEPLDGPTENTEEEEEEWPPFRKVGHFDPFSDDPRLAIKKISLCPTSGVLLIAGSAGQVVILKLNEDAVTDKQIKVSTINIIPEKDNPDEVTYMWKGSQRLGLKGKAEEKNKTTLSVAAGYQPSSIVQILPPAAVTAVALNANWCLVAVGTAHGLALYDFKTETPVLHKCTLNSNDYSSLSETPISRTKSFKKSLRESFRRIRKGRASGRHHDKHGSKSSLSAISPPGADRKRVGNESASSGSPVISPLDARPIERAIEAKPADNSLSSMVKCLHFYNTNVVHAHHAIPSLWAGTNNGCVYIFTINVPGGVKRKNEKANAQLGKEIQLQHRAPVVSISAINMGHKLLHVDDTAGHSGAHFVIICSEEQIKLFSLPNLKPIGKLKLTALEGARVRRAALGQFSAINHTETCLMLLTNLGECVILSIPDLRRQDTAAVIKREDINGISSFTFTNYGEGLFLLSSSELQRIALSPSRKTVPHCTLMVAHSKKALLNTTPITPEKQNHYINGIPEEDEEEADPDEEGNENDDSLIKKEPNEDDVKTPLNGDEHQIIFNHDVSAITLDSVKDHLS